MGLREEFLRLLKEDKEFRMAVAGYLGLREVLEELRRLRGDFNKFVKGQEARWGEASGRFSRLVEGLGALTEAVYTRYVWEDLGEVIQAPGERVVRRVRSADFDGVEVDLLVETEGRVYVVEVKVRPRIDDVGALLAKAEVVGRMLGKPAVPVLVGSYIGREVEAYARGKGVLVYVY
ncbi:hypothetical protein [Pyrobaculum sp.]|uniref:hypothetical protein n=1 Tax=Pyrobaculum sp. TaxID=2004705 RepID=UPI00317F544D